MSQKTLLNCWKVKGKEKKRDDDAKKSDEDRDIPAAKRAREFNYGTFAKWQKTYPWLSEIDSKLICVICKINAKAGETTFIDGCSTFKLETVKSHHASKVHQQACSIYKAQTTPSETPLAIVVAKMNKDMENSLRTLFLIAYTVAKGDFTLNDFEDMCALQKKIGNPIGETYLNRWAAKEFISYIAKDVEGRLAADINNSHFICLMADASTDNSLSENEIVYVQYLQGPSLKTSFLGLKPIEDATASGTLQTIDKIMSKNIPLWKSKLIGCCFDGASVNLGSIGGVGQQLKNEINGLVVIHCLNHRLELALSDACKDVSFLAHFEIQVKGLYKFYNKSPKLVRNIKDIAEVLEEKFIKCRNINTVRWISSKHRAVSALCKNLHLIITHLKQIVSKTENGKVGAKAKGYLRHITSVRFVKFLHFMHDVSKILSSTSLVLQKDNLSLYHGLQEVQACLLSIDELLTSKGDKEKEIESTINSGDYKGIALISEQKRGELGSFEEDRRKLLISIKTHISDRITPLNDIISLAKLFDPFHFPDDFTDEEFDCSKLKELCQNLPQPVLDQIDIDCIAHEYNRFRTYVKSLITASVITRPTLQSLYNRLYAENEVTGLYKNIMHIIQFIQLIPCSTAACERGFSAMNRIKTKFRSRLEIEILHDLLMIRLNGESLDVFDPIRAIKLWWLSTSDGKIRHTSYNR